MHFRDGARKLNVKTGPRHAAIVTVLPPLALVLALAGCAPPHLINDEDARNCELQGLPRGSDVNANCALKREADRVAAGEEPTHKEPAPSTPMPDVPPPPPAHPGATSQTTELRVPPGTTATVNFFVSLNPDCSSNGQVAVRIDKQPPNGTAKVIPRDDYARAAQSGLPLACVGKKVSGVAVEYMPNSDYTGTDSLEFETTAKSGAKALFKVPITVAVPTKDPDDDDDK